MRTLVAIFLSLLVFTACEPQKSRKRKTTARVTIRTNPKGATVVLDGKKKLPGTTPMEEILDNRNGHMLEVSLAGYETKWVRLPKLEAGETEYDLNEIELKQRTSPVIIDSDPAGALLTFNNQDMGKTPVYLKAVPHGDYEAEFKYTGRASMRKTIKVSGKSHHVFKAQLESIMGKLTVLTNPGGCDVFVDGSFRGKSDGDGRFVVPELVEGRHVVVIKKGGYDDGEQAFILKRTENKVLKMAEMQQKPGAIKVTSNPAGASVWRDDLLVGITPATIQNVEPGDVRLRIDLSGHTPVRRSVKVLPGVTRVVNVTLVSSFGGITITTEPSGCTIIVGGAMKGKTVASDVPGVSKPLTIKDLRPGVHNVSVRHGGYQSKNSEVLVEKGKVNVMKVIKLKKLWMPTHYLKVKGSTKVVPVLVHEDNGTVLDIEEKHRNGAIIRYRVKRENITFLKKVE